MMKTRLSRILSIFIILLLAASTFAIISNVAHAVNGTEPQYTYQETQDKAFLEALPTTQTVGAIEVFAGWVSPSPPMIPNTSHGIPNTGYYVNIINPSGTNTTLGPFTSDSLGSFYTDWTIPAAGNYTAQLVWSGQVGGGKYYGACMSNPEKFTAVTYKVPTWPEVPLPTNFWQTTGNGATVNDMNRAWYTIDGAWIMSTGDGEKDEYNAFSQAPLACHICWIAPTALAGLGGGNFQDYYQAVTAATPLAAWGYIYYTEGPNIVCANPSNGHILWTRNTAQNGIAGTTTASISAIEDLQQASTQVSAGVAPSWSVGGIWCSYTYGYVEYAPFSGETICNCTVIGSTIAGVLNPSKQAVVPGITAVIDDPVTGQCYLYGSTTGNAVGANGQIIQGVFIKWNATVPYGGTTPNLNWTQDVCWVDNATNIFAFCGVTQPGSFASSGYDVIESQGTSVNTVVINDTSGKIVWQNDFLNTPYQPETVGGIGYGDIFQNCDDGSLRCWSIATGDLLWTAAPKPLPNGEIGQYGMGEAYGLVFENTYAGVYCYNATNGNLVWQFHTDNPNGTGVEIPYSQGWPIGQNNGAIADGLYFVGSIEHSPTNPTYRGWMLYAINAYTGALTWAIPDMSGTPALAYGYLYSAQEYTGTTWCIGKGPSQTTVSAPCTTVQAGSPVMITGTVTDQSPAQPSTPCVADPDMAAWMDYLHMQIPLPTATTVEGTTQGAAYPYYPTGYPTTFSGTGVEVTVTATSPSGATTTVGTAYTGTTGQYALQFTPPSTGIWTISTTFTGTNSYYASSNSTYLDVGSAAAAPTATPTSIANAYFVPATIAIIIIVIIGFVVLAIISLKRRPVA